MSLRTLLILALTLLALGCGGSGETDSNEPAQSGASARGGEDFTPVIAKVGDIEITQGYFDFRYELLSPQDRARFSGEDWKNRFLDHLVEETLLYAAAKRDKFDLLREVERRLDVAERSILVKAYYDKNFKEDIRPTEEEIRTYYENNKDKYLKLGMVYGYHIQCSTKEKIDEAARRIADGERFVNVAGKMSENPATKDKGGELGWFNPDGFVIGIGYSKKFTDLAFSMDDNEVSKPFQLDDDNWHLLKIASKSETEVQSMEDVWDRIETSLSPILAKEAYTEALVDLRGNLGVERFGEYQEKEIRTAEQLYRLGGESRNPNAKLNYFQNLVELYPDHEYVDDSLFMIGFIASEEFGDVTTAAVAFRRIIKEMPDSDYADESRWMLRNLGGGNAALRGSGVPEDPAAAAERVERQLGGG